MMYESCMLQLNPDVCRHVTMKKTAPARLLVFVSLATLDSSVKQVKCFNFSDTINGQMMLKMKLVDDMLICVVGEVFVE